jgi:hypothetical protein
LIVCEKGISVSNIANGTTRLQPVVLLTGQAAGVVAAQCIAKHIQPRKVDVRVVQNELLKIKCYLLPFCDVDPSDPAWQAVQQAGALGILKGIGKSIAWENKTFFYPDSSIKTKDFIHELKSYIANPVETNDGWLSIGEAQQIIAQYSVAVKRKLNQERYVNQRGFNATVWDDTLHLTNFAIARKITRKELAVLFDYYNGSFVECKVDFKGNLQP